jgi:poly [ADP-ribose] polymerase 2/3/4
MPPKRKAAVARKAPTPAKGVAKKVKVEEVKVEEVKVEEEGITKENIVQKLKEADKNNINKKKVHTVDKIIPLSLTYKVHEDFDCTLNQTNIGFNNNKFYIIQVLEKNGNYFT